MSNDIFRILVLISFSFGFMFLGFRSRNRNDLKIGFGRPRPVFEVALTGWALIFFCYSSIALGGLIFLLSVMYLFDPSLNLQLIFGISGTLSIGLIFLGLIVGIAKFIIDNVIQILGKQRDDEA